MVRLLIISILGEHGFSLHQIVWFLRRGRGSNLESFCFMLRTRKNVPMNGDKDIERTRGGQREEKERRKSDEGSSEKEEDMVEGDDEERGRNGE